MIASNGLKQFCKPSRVQEFDFAFYNKYSTTDICNFDICLIFAFSAVTIVAIDDEDWMSAAPDDSPPCFPAHTRPLHVRQLRVQLGGLPRQVQHGAVHQQGEVRQVGAGQQSAVRCSAVMQGQCIHGSCRAQQ